MEDAVFGGLLRPAKILSVPIVPAILLCLTHGIGIMWAMVLFPPAVIVVVASFLVIFIWARQQTAIDDQRLFQYLLRFRFSKHRSNRKHWKCSSCYSPYRSTFIRKKDR